MGLATHLGRLAARRLVAVHVVGEPDDRHLRAIFCLAAASSLTIRASARSRSPCAIASLRFRFAGLLTKQSRSGRPSAVAP